MVFAQAQHSQQCSAASFETLRSYEFELDLMLRASIWWVVSTVKTAKLVALSLLSVIICSFSETAQYVPSFLPSNATNHLIIQYFFVVEDKKK